MNVNFAEATVGVRMKNRRRMLMLGSLGVMLGVFAGGLLFAVLRRPATVSGVPGETEQITAAKPDPRLLAERHLRSAATHSRDVIQDHTLAVQAFFDDTQSRTQSFAEIALGWGSKWRLIADHVPFTKGGRHETFIRGEFERTVFSAAQLENIVSDAVSEYLAEMNSIENQMLVSLRADVVGFSSSIPVADWDQAQWKEKFDEAIQRAITAAGSQLQADLGTQLVSIIGGEVMAQVALRMGISAGILGTGAAAGWATFGIGMVVGVMVDQIVSWVWEWWADPSGDLAKRLDAKLDEMCVLICDGDAKVDGLRQRFDFLATQRAKIREAAIFDLLSILEGTR